MVMFLNAKLSTGNSFRNYCAKSKVTAELYSLKTDLLSKVLHFFSVNNLNSAKQKMIFFKARFMPITFVKGMFLIMH